MFNILGKAASRLRCILKRTKHGVSFYIHAKVLQWGLNQRTNITIKIKTIPEKYYALNLNTRVKTRNPKLVSTVLFSSNFTYIVVRPSLDNVCMCMCFTGILLIHICFCTSVFAAVQLPSPISIYTVSNLKFV